jgi:tetratricopeptide (TPR) repeat protein
MIESILKGNAREVKRLLRFLTRDGSGGVLFAVAKDYRIIPAVTAYLIDQGKEAGVSIYSFNLSGETSQDSFGAIIKLVIDEAQGLIITNLDLLIFKGGQEAQSTGILADINYSREAMMQLRKPILIWFSPDGFLAFQRLAVDFYTQRAGNTVFFDEEIDTKKIEYQLSDSLGPGDEKAQAQSEITMLNIQLNDALKSNQSKARIANNIVVELLGNYATLYKNQTFIDSDDPYEQAYNDLFDQYQQDLDFSNPAIITNIALSYNEVNGPSSESLKFLTDALKLTKASDFIGKVILLLLSLSDFYNEIERNEEALEYLNELVDWLKINQLQELINGVLIRSRFGNIYRDLNRLPEALESYEKLYDTQQKLVQDHPDSDVNKYWLASACSSLGETHVAMGNLPKAIVYFEQRLDILTGLREEQPNELDHYHNLAVTYEKLAETHKALGNKAQAQAAFEQLLSNLIEVVEADPNDLNLKTRLTKAYLRIGAFAYYDLGNNKKATDYYKMAYKLRNELKALNFKPINFINFSEVPKDIAFD